MNFTLDAGSFTTVHPLSRLLRRLAMTRTRSGVAQQPVDASRIVVGLANKQVMTVSQAPDQWVECLEGTL